MADAAEPTDTPAPRSSSDAATQEPSAGEAVGDLLDLSDYLPPLPVSNSSTSAGKMTGNERIPSEQQQQQQQQQTEQKQLESPQIAEDGPPPTVDELIVEYGSSRPSSPCSVPASPGDVLEAAGAAPGNDNLTTENVVMNGAEGQAADEQPPQSQLNGEKLVPAVENVYSDAIQVGSDDNADADTNAEHLEQKEKDKQVEQQHMPNGDSLLNSSTAPLPQAQDGPAEVAKSETNGTVSNDYTADEVASSADTKGAAPEKTHESESAPTNEGDESDDAPPMPSQISEPEEQIINAISDDKDEEVDVPSVDDNECDAPVANDESASVPVIEAEETHRIEPSAEEDGKNGYETNECIDGNTNTNEADDTDSGSVPTPATENGEGHANNAEEVEVLGQSANIGQYEKTAQEQEEAPGTSSEGPALENKAPPQGAELEQNARDEHKSSDEAPMGFTLTFADYVDLQSRLVLVPLDDGECLGAKIASFGMPVQEQPQQHAEASEGNYQVDASDTMEDIELDAESSEEKKGEDADDNLQSGVFNETDNTLKSHSNLPIEPEDVVGSVLVKIPGLVGDNGEEDDDDWTQVDFTYILSATRDVEAPISLHFRRTDDEGTTSTHGNDAEIRTSESNSRTILNEQSGVVAAGETDSAAVSKGTMSTRLSRWGSRASQLALEAKEKARIAMEEAERQLEKKGIADRLASVTSSKIDGDEGNEPNAEETEGDADEELTPTPRSWEEAGLDRPPCGLYLQKASGTFAQLDISPEIADVPQVPQISESSLSKAVPLRPTLSSSSVSSRSSIAGLSWRKKLARLHPVTNTSVLLVRAAAESPCPAKGYEYQWYRSCKRNADDTSSVSYSSSHSGANDASSLESIDGWFALDGATYAAFQPSATDIGHRIRCVTTIHSTARMLGAADEKPISEGPIQVICELPFPVVADASLFSAARQGFAAPNGGIFANLKGRGNASGRSFRLQIMPSEEGSRMRMFQTSGSTAELLHDVKEPIVFASATAMPAEPKVFDLFFPSGLPESAEMVRALCNDDGHFKLKAPNRIARESLLLSLGIANFCAFGGKPVDMNASSTLFPDTPHGAVIEYDCSKQNSTKEGDTATTPHAVREVKVVSPVQEERADDSADPLPLPRLVSSDVKPAAPEERTRAWMSPMLTLSPKTPGTESTMEADARFQALEAELRSKIDTIFSKEKACSDLQRRVAAAESGKRRSDDQVKHLKSESEMYKRRHTECSRALRSAERKIEMNDNAMARMRQEYEARIASLEDRIKQNASTSSEQEKTITTLSNEKAVLEAAVEARDGKLSAMDLLQDTVSDLRKQVADNESAKKNLGRCKAELDEMTTRFNDAQKKLEKTRQLKALLQESQENAKKEQKAAERCKAQMESANVRCQKLKVELRSARQKVESLSKDLSRAHATTRSASKDVEQDKKMKSIQRECEELKNEISHLTSEKRRIAEERDESRRLHEQSIKSQVEAGIDEKVVRALERYDELERVISELTEYIEAKEMQLETMMEVNKSLQDEIASLRK